MYNPFFAMDNPTIVEQVEANKVAIIEISKKLNMYDETIEKIVNYLDKLDEEVIAEVTRKLQEMYDNGDFTDILSDVTHQYFDEFTENFYELLNSLISDITALAHEVDAQLWETEGKFIPAHSENPDHHNYDPELNNYNEGDLGKLLANARDYYNERYTNFPNGTSGPDVKIADNTYVPGKYRFCYVQKFTPADKDFDGVTTHYINDDEDRPISKQRLSSIALDCSSFVQMIMAGINWRSLVVNKAYGDYHPWNSPNHHYFNNLLVRQSYFSRDNNGEGSGFNWAFFPMAYGVRNVGELLEMFTLAGMRVAINPAYIGTEDYPRGEWNFDGVEVGDIIFFDKNHKNTEHRYLGADHCAIVVGERDIGNSDISERYQPSGRISHTTPPECLKVHPMLECTSSSYFIRNRLLETTYYKDDEGSPIIQCPEQVVAICRPPIRTPQPAKLQEACTKLMFIGLTEGTRGDIADIED